ncbi:MAG TPA: carbon monoxide dehydrogenase subunit G [Gammaproteobacteria bacterium]|nr:carbon monoxide dehydrogenase subunit G [Gammaproteobacteria bacterium]
MDVTGQYRIAMPRESVWRALMDVDTLSRCIPGCESLEQTAPNAYRARVALAVGPVRAAFDTDLSLSDINAPESYRIAGSGRAGAVGFGQGEARVALTQDAEAATLLSYSAGFQVGGRLAQVGSRLVLGATRKLVDEFFANLVREMDAASVRIDAATPSRPSRRQIWIWISAGILLLGVLYWLLGAGPAP